ncbi:MAG TPA: hypothetical protein VK789_33140, partial [Bryobacteraceae bacterium]|nr:hypothetical protein [Bryobacteraceae bacterium]
SLPIVLSESDPEGCAGCSARVYPQNAYRNGPLYPAYTAAMLSNILKLADKHKANIEGMLTWAFEFETSRISTASGRWRRTASTSRFSTSFEWMV